MRISMCRPKYALWETVSACAVALLVGATLHACGDDNMGPMDGDSTETVVSVVVTPGSVTLASFGETVMLTARARSSTGGIIAGKTFTWSSSDESVAAVSAAGELTAVSNGTARITATADGVSGTAEALVDQAVASVEVTPENPTISAYGVFGGAQLSALALDAMGNAVGRVTAFTWSTSDEVIARVDSHGAVVTLAPGSVVITASADGVDGSTTIISAPPPVPTDGLQAHFPFTDNAMDRSGKAHHGTVLGATLTTDRFQNTTAAYSFDGVDDFVDLGNSFDDLQLPFTLSTWVFKTGSDNTFDAIFASDDSPSNPGLYYGFWMIVDTLETVGIAYGDGGFPAASNRRTYRSVDPIPLDRWTHIAATVRAATDMTLYVDGVEVNGTFTGTGGAMIHNPSWPARIGLGTFGGVGFINYFHGLIDDLRLYNRSLSASESRQLYQEGGFTPNP